MRTTLAEISHTNSIHSLSASQEFGLGSAELRSVRAERGGWATEYARLNKRVRVVIPNEVRETASVSTLFAVTIYMILRRVGTLQPRCGSASSAADAHFAEIQDYAAAGHRPAETNCGRKRENSST